jgi:hypothetical protein
MSSSENGVGVGGLFVGVDVGMIVVVGGNVDVGLIVVVGGRVAQYPTVNGGSLLGLHFAKQSFL